MNERIKELAEQAANGMLSYDAEGDWRLSGKEVEKFAELIVRECIKESMEEIVADDDIAQECDQIFRAYLKGNNQGIVDAVVRFRNHFGVKE